MLQQVIDLTGEKAILQGATWSGVVSFYISEDLSLGTPKGQIRTNYLHAGGMTIADFDFAPITYSPISLPGWSTPQLRSAIIPSLSAVKAAAISIPAEGNYFYYDMFVVMPTRVIKVARGRVEVLPRVTDPLWS
jgi:hypothetical protein